jgi:hypothetical protein
LKNPPTAYPEYVPQNGNDIGRYHLREAGFWTCGFFPGSLYALLERVIKYPQATTWSNGIHDLGIDGRIRQQALPILRSQLLDLCREWSEPLHTMAYRTDTHDIGFIVEPALRADWELTGNQRSLSSLVTAAHSLASRYVPEVKAIRSWDLINKKEIIITSMEENCIVIIDSLCNLDLLYYASAHSSNDNLANIATKHAHTLLKTHLRPESRRSPLNAGYKGVLYSTCHVAVLDPVTGGVKQRLSAQGYSLESTWARGQSWGILGYAQAYMWTRDINFLKAACGLAEYFLYRLEISPACVEVEIGPEIGDGRKENSKRMHRTIGRFVPLWDFDAPIDNPDAPLRDSSAGVIAANGMLVLSQALAGAEQPKLSKYFRQAAITIVKDILAFSLAQEKARFAYEGNDAVGDVQLVVEDCVGGQTFDSVLKNATANNNEGARRRYWNHGLVYGDYYLIEFGNRLLRMGLV